ncbi:beta-mannosidase isoform X2 [Paramuricea clavata]|uniref:Beta-mannosidase isoform X2 n=1 Tax=Paramuricea clavata TaxID=317549 RepID=A0A6S7FS09_PARCT|nr:beta-mannosidase isoform X2 [Paramuricea clavata]
MSYLLLANSSSVSWYLKVTVVIDCGSEESMGSVVATLPRFGVASKAMVHCTMSSVTQVYLPTITLLDDEHRVRTWWPRGYGSQPLYDLTVTYKDTQTFEISTKTIRIGFREVKLVQEQITGGLSFYYKVNDVAIFMKGANWIPADAFEDRVTDDVIRNILQSSADANMNIVRNWGGGIYQHDSFYSIADELGLLIWQEFMFACDYYPADEQFLDSVRKEVTHQIQRLQYHPSVLIWSGNNEIESSVSQNWYGVKNLTLYKENYVKLFIDTIRSTVLGLDSSRPFVSSSPSDGVQTEKEGWISSNPNSDFYGDVHYYNYTMDCLDIRGYPQPRFASEYGLQSLPRFQTLSSVTVKDDWSYFSPIMMHRQHHGSGNEQMLNQTKMHFKIPNSADPLKHFKDMLYLTQASQAICIKAESEHYRRLRSVMNEGRGHTMGAIYWQLNSIWPAPTWSSLEYGGRWKMLHYYAKDFFSPIIISPFEFNNTLYIFAVSDLLQILNISLIPFNEFLITLKSTALAPFVWLESGDIPGRFSDNGFLITQQFTQIVFYCWQPSISVDDLKQALTVSSLYDVYTEPEFTDTVSVRN